MNEFWYLNQVKYELILLSEPNKISMNFVIWTKKNMNVSVMKSKEYKKIKMKNRD